MISIIDWIWCFSLYIAIGVLPEPDNYYNHMWFPDFHWATYDWEFLQQAVAMAVPEQTVLDNTLWNLARQSAADPINYPNT